MATKDLELPEIETPLMGMSFGDDAEYGAPGGGGMGPGGFGGPAPGDDEDEPISGLAHQAAGAGSDVFSMHNDM